MEELFAGRSVYQHMTDQEMKVRALVRALSRYEIERRGTAAVVDALMAQCAFTPPALDTDRMLPPTLEERGDHGAEVTFSVPFTGDRTLFFVRPASAPIRLTAEVERTALVLSYASPTRNAADVRAEVDRIISDIRRALAQIDADLRAFSTSLRAAAQEAVERHHAVLTAAQAPAAAFPAGKPQK
jgi:hypothetical protein